METKVLNSVVKHLEHYLGEISYGWSDDKSLHAIKVVSFKDQPTNDIVTYSTLGLSEMELALPRERQIRQELVLSAHTSFSGEEIAGFMLSCAEHIAEQGRAVLRGEVIDPSRPLIKGVTVSAVYATNPTPFSDGFSEFANVTPPVIFVLLIPITKGENLLIRNEGWSWFEEMLESQDPDIWDLARTDQVLKQ